MEKVTFPTMKNKYTGQEVSTRNKKCAEFTGTIEAFRPIKSETNPYCFAVTDIKVKGEPGVFQYYWNYNGSTQEKAEASGKFYVKKVKELATACGKDVNYETERNGEWCQKTLVTLHKEKPTIKFLQTMESKGLDITFLPPTDDDNSEEEEY